MRRYTTAAKVGAFTVVLLVAGFYIYRFVNKTMNPSEGYVVYALMDDATGISPRSQVRIAGIAVGTVESIRLQEGKARVDMRIRRDVALYDDAAVAKVAASLLGEYFLSITPGTEGKRQLDDGDRILYVIDAVSTDEILKQVADIARDVKKVTEALADSVGSEEGKENLKDTLENLARVTEALNQTVRENRDSIRTITTNIENITTRSGPEIAQILENVRESTKEVRELLAEPQPGQAPGTAGDIRQTIERVKGASEKLESAMQSIDTVAGRLERGEGTLGRLTKDEKLINEVEGVVEGVGEFVGGISRLQTIVVLRTDYQFLASTVKSYVELRLQPREDKYYSIEIVNDPRGLTRIEQISVETDRREDAPGYFERREVTSNAFRFSLQFAQRFGPFTGRFGIKESTGGAGLDLSLFDDRFEVRSDLFGFGEVVTPRLRISGGYEFISRLWLLVGVDDILVAERRDYFIGLQLKFNDEDLKTVLPFAPGP